MDFLNSRLTFGMSLGLRGMKSLCEAFQFPERSFRSIHIVGTNGKGSASFYLAGLLQAHGARVGFFSSPHLVSVRERIRFQDAPIPEADLERLLFQVREVSAKIHLEPSFFETITMVSLLYFREMKVEYAVLEAGLGGRLDTTSVAEGFAALLTSIGLEHTEILGNTEEKILKEKLGILRPETVLFAGDLSDKLLSLARSIAEPLHVKVVPAEKFKISAAVPNLGKHYQENADLAITAARFILGGRWNANLAAEVLPKRAWAGRMQVLKNAAGKIRFILDGAHNSHAVKRLTETLAESFPGQKFTCLFAVLQDKDCDEMISMLRPFISEWVLTRTPYPRFQDLDVLRTRFDAQGIQVTRTEMLSEKLIKSLESSENPVLVTGSLYMIGAVIQLLKTNYPELSFFENLSVTFNENH
jgi:dihydrofolate synthase/folylpolyglutamate synthase